MTVGAVYRIVTLYLSVIAQGRPASGYVGTPSKMTWLAALSNGPYVRYEWPADTTHGCSSEHERDVVCETQAPSLARDIGRQMHNSATDTN